MALRKGVCRMLAIDPFWIVAAGTAALWLAYDLWIEWHSRRPLKPAELPQSPSMPSLMPATFEPPATLNTSDGLNIVALARGSERYIVIYTDSEAEQAAIKLGQWASHPDLSLTWREAQAGIRCIRGPN